MRRLHAHIPILSLLLLPGVSLRSQETRAGWHLGLGYSEATLNFQQNAAGAFAIPIRYDFLSMRNSAFSLGANVKLGSEDEYGVSFPALLLLMAAADAAGGSNADLSGLGSSGSTSSSSSYSIEGFADLPLILQYNWGLGTRNESGHRFGWFVGGGLSYTVTGVSLNSSGHGESENFLGRTAVLGIRFHRSNQLFLSATLPFQNSIGPIQHPLLFSLTIAYGP